MSAARRPRYDVSVFINCPFDEGYKPLFEAITFAVLACGFHPRSALEIENAAQTRIDKIMTLIARCRYGIHDISRTELDAASGLPRFNMPLELGIFLGARQFGAGLQKEKACLVVDRERHRYQKFISDIAGQDITAHGGQSDRAIACVRSFLAADAGATILPGGGAIMRSYHRFLSELPAIRQGARLEIVEVTYTDFVTIAAGWLRDEWVSGAS